MPLNLYLKGTNRLVTRLTEKQLQSLVELLVQETPTDRDYHVDEGVISYLAAQGCDADLVGSLRSALGARVGGYREAVVAGEARPGEGIEVEWREE